MSKNMSLAAGIGEDNSMKCCVCVLFTFHFFFSRKTGPLSSPDCLEGMPKFMKSSPIPRIPFSVCFSFSLVVAETITSNRDHKHIGSMLPWSQRRCTDEGVYDSAIAPRLLSRMCRNAWPAQNMRKT